MPEKINESRGRRAKKKTSYSVTAHYDGIKLQINPKEFERIKVTVNMMRHLTEEEVQLMDKLHNDKTLTENEKEDIRKKLIEIDKREVRDIPFCH